VLARVGLLTGDLEFVVDFLRIAGDATPGPAFIAAAGPSSRDVDGRELTGSGLAVLLLESPVVVHSSL
jgi:hypothetical protein